MKRLFNKQLNVWMKSKLRTGEKETTFVVFKGLNEIGI